MKRCAYDKLAAELGVWRPTATRLARAVEARRLSREQTCEQGSKRDVERQNPEKVIE